MEEMREQDVELLENEEETDMEERNNDEIECYSAGSSISVAKVAVGTAILVGAGIAVKKFVVPKVKSGIEKMKAKRAAKKQVDDSDMVDDSETYDEI